MGGLGGAQASCSKTRVGFATVTFVLPATRGLFGSGLFLSEGAYGEYGTGWRGVKGVLLEGYTSVPERTNLHTDILHGCLPIRHTECTKVEPSCFFGFYLLRIDFEFEE